MKNFISRCIAEGATRANVQDFANAPIPPMPRRSWMTGCDILIPKELEVLVVSMNGDHGPLLPFIVVEVVFPDGYYQVDRLFLNTLVRCIKQEDGSLLTTTGAVANMIRSCSCWAEAMDRLRGTRIYIESDTACTMVSPKGEARVSHIYRFEFAYALAA